MSPEDQTLITVCLVLAVGAVFLAGLCFAGLVYLQHKLQDQYDKSCDHDDSECLCVGMIIDLSRVTQRNSDSLKTLFRQLQATQDRLDGLEMHARPVHSGQAQSGNVPSNV